MSSTTTTSGTPINHKMIGIVGSLRWFPADLTPAQRYGSRRHRGWTRTAKATPDSRTRGLRRERRKELPSRGEYHAATARRRDQTVLAHIIKGNLFSWSGLSGKIGKGGIHVHSARFSCRRPGWLLFSDPSAHRCGDIGKHFAKPSESCVVHDRRTRGKGRFAEAYRSRGGQCCGRCRVDGTIRHRHSRPCRQYPICC